MKFKKEINAVEKINKTINYNTDMDTLIKVQHKCGYVQIGYVLDYDDEYYKAGKTYDGKPVLPRFVFKDYASGDISEEYFVDIKQVYTIR